MNYQNNCRNTFGWLVGLGYKSTKLDILIISLVCVDGRFSKIQSHKFIMNKIIISIYHYCANFTSEGYAQGEV